jgi:hypothetical protein
LCHLWVNNRCRWKVARKKNVLLLVLVLVLEGPGKTEDEKEDEDEEDRPPRFAAM